jgi:hypothetical protein
MQCLGEQMQILTGCLHKLLHPAKCTEAEARARLCVRPLITRIQFTWPLIT